MSAEIKSWTGPPVLPVPVLPIPNPTGSCCVFNIGTGPREITTYGSGFCQFYRFLPVPPILVPTGSRFQKSTKILSRSRPDRFYPVLVSMPVSVPVPAGFSVQMLGVSNEDRVCNSKVRTEGLTENEEWIQEIWALLGTKKSKSLILIGKDIGVTFIS